MRYPPHRHDCQFKAQGCKGFYACNADPERDEDGPHCPYDNEIYRCEDCTLSACDECGEVLQVSKHADDCPRATQV